MIKVFREWYGRHFTDPQQVILLLLIGLGLALALFVGDILAPLLVSILLAYILEGLIRALEEARIPRLFSFLLVYVLFVAALLLLLLRLVPVLSEQIVDLAARLPSMLAAGQRWVESLPELYPELVSPIQVEQILMAVRAEVLAFADEIIRFSLDTVVDVLSIVVYTVVVPILVFFLLKDKRRILDWAKTYLPAPQSLSSQVWGEMDLKVSQYLRGKLIEIGVVWVATFFAFALFGLQYALLLSFLVGLSVIIPYVGAGGGDGPGYAGRRLPVGPEPGVRLPDAGLPRDPVPGRKPAGAAAVFGSGQPPSGRHPDRDPGVRWVLGRVGRAVRHPPGFADRRGVAQLAARRAGLGKNQAFDRSATAASTSVACSDTRTLRQTRRTTPSGSIRKVLRSMPRTFRPYMFFILMTS